MAPSLPLQDDRKPSLAESASSVSSSERRPSGGSSFALAGAPADHGLSNANSTTTTLSAITPRSSPFHPEDRPRPFASSRQHSSSSSHHGLGLGHPNHGYHHPLDAIAQTPIPSFPSSTTPTPKKKHHRDNDSSLFSFFRSSSRPPSPDNQHPGPDHPHEASHTRKTSFGSYRNQAPHPASSTLLSPSSSSGTLNSSYNYYHANNASTGALSQGGHHGHGHGQGHGHSQGQHPFSPDHTTRRGSHESYSRPSSPDSSGDLVPPTGQRHLPPTTPPGFNQGHYGQGQGPHRPHHRTGSSSKEPHHRRTKSTDFGDMFTKKNFLVHDDPVVSPAKETKKTLFSMFIKKKSSLPHPSATQTEGPSRKHSSVDDPALFSPPSTTSLNSYQPVVDQDGVFIPPASYLERRHGSEGGDSQKSKHSINSNKKTSKKGSASYDTILPDSLVAYSDLPYFRDDQMNAPFMSLAAAANSADQWMPPESWGVKPSSLSSAGSSQKPVVLTLEDATSEDADQSDFENWDYGSKKLSTVRIFRPDTTYTTVNCVFHITTGELSKILAKKIFKPDISKYHVYVLRNNIARPLGPNEKPLNILRRSLLQFGYTDQDKLDELSGKDNSFLCRFTFAENGVPLVTEADFPDHHNYADMNLQRRCLPTIPIFLYSRAKDIVRLNVSQNPRIDLPLDFVQNCSALRELRMANNDLDRIPSNIRSIGSLQILDVRGNRIKDLEKAHLEDARQLLVLILQCNRLETLPDSFQTFEYLRILNLSSNSLAKVPASVCQIISLEELDLSFNEVTDIPDEISQLIRLRKLMLYGNKIGQLPKSMGCLVSLRKLDIRQNGILNLDSINDLRSLEELLVDYNTNVILNNSFRALVRASVVKCNMTDVNIIGTDKTLIFLDLSSNKLSNLADNLFEHLRSLETLKLDNNSICSIPSTIGLLKRLRTLSIANNALSSLPDEIAQLESLLELDVHSNSLGELPSSIWKCSLTYLNASSNVLESFPDPPELDPSAEVVISASSSADTLYDSNGQLIEPTPGKHASSSSPSSSQSKPLPAPPTNTLVNTFGRSPLAQSLLTLSLADNRLPDEVFYPLSEFFSLQILNLSHNYIVEVPRGKIPNSANLIKFYLSGNQLSNLPADDIEPLRSLRVLHVNGNKLTTLPAELGKIHRLTVLDVGCNMLKYNISNWPYDWNWNWNLELKYLNMSGNKRLQIKRQTTEGTPTASRPGNLSEFGNLTRLRILGLMDVTITDNVPEDSMERRIRTSMSSLQNMSYGMADTLGDDENLCIFDLVHPKFQTKDDECLFGLFDGRDSQSQASCRMASHLKDRFGACLKVELEKMEGLDTVVSALRRTFLGLDRELWSISPEEQEQGGVSALVAYIRGVTLYSANVGDTIAVLVKKLDTFQVISQKHIPWNPTEASRIKRSGGFVSENGLLNDELDISRSFGQYHLVPIVNSNPFIEITTLTEDDDFVIMASKSFWDVMSYTTAVDIARAGKRVYGDLMYASQKLRDIAISYGASEHMVVMLIGVGDLFKKKEPSESLEYHQPKYKRPKATEGPLDALKYLQPEVEPPQGDVAMVFTYIKNAAKLWEAAPIAMAIAIKEQFNVMRRQLRSIGGYEVKNEADVMMASFSSVPAAMLWCLKVQELLLSADWPQGILDAEDGQTIYIDEDRTQPIYRGLSVRMGIHWGQPASHRDEVTHRMDYFGSMVNRSARICATADGGEICVSADVMNEIQPLLQDADLDQSDSPHAEHVREIKKMGLGIVVIGERKLKGLETAENLHLIYSRMLAGRFTRYPTKTIGGSPVSHAPVTRTVALDAVSVRMLQTISLRLERLVSGVTAIHGRVTPDDLELLSLPIKDNEEQDILAQIADNCISRIENCFSQLYMAKSGQFIKVYESLSKVLDGDGDYVMRALQMYINIMGGMDSPTLL